jgi:hypothetical protein
MREYPLIANGKASWWRKENEVIIPKIEGIIKRRPIQKYIH